MNLRHLLFLIFFFAFGIESGKIRPNFDEIFGDGWNTNQREENREESVRETIGQMSEYSNQNVIRSDQKMKTDPNDQQKKESIRKFEAIKEKLKQKGKYQRKNNTKIERKIAKLLGTNRKKIYKWKKELKLNKKKTMETSFYKEKKSEFIERFDEFKSLYGQRKQKEFVKELGISKFTFWKWKKELMPNYHKTQNKYSNEDKLKKMKQYFEIKKRNSKISDEIIAGKLEIAFSTLQKWKKKFALVSEK